MAEKYLHTSDLPRRVGVHPNTVRKYVDWGLIPPVERTPSGYRLFTRQHLDCLRLARLIYAAPYPGRGFRALGNEVIQHAVLDDWQGALEKAHEHLALVQAELQNAENAADLLELPPIWWQGDPDAWPDFLGIAKAEGMRTLFVGRAVLEAEDLQDLAEWVEEKEGPGHSNGDRARLKTLERYIGLTGEIRLGWIKDGVAFLLQQQTEWYTEFLDLMDEVEETEEMED